jgi:protein gp37
MSANSLIEWTDTTWNPVRGCTKVSSGCLNCYAEKFAERFRGVPGHPFEQGFDLRLAPWKLLEPLSWLQPSTVFVNSMSDLFHEDVPDDYIVAAFEVMAAVDWHVYQVLTKRPERMQRLIADRLRFASKLEHIWWGATVENRKQGLPRVDALRNSDVAMRFLSCEPLLEHLGKVNLDGIGWVIVGGESGREARRMEKEWVISLRDQCDRAKVPFFFKQWGGFPKAKYGCLLDGNEYKEVPPSQTRVVPPLDLRRSIKANLSARLFSSELVPLVA